MNRERAKELLPIIQAFADGKGIQFRLNDPGVPGSEHWLSLPENENLILTFPADDYEYRIKPKPREFWISNFPPDDDRSKYRTVYDGKGPPHYAENWIKVREVLE